METIEIRTGRAYTVCVGANLLADTGKTVAALGARQVAVVSDSNVFPLWGRAVQDSLAAAGIDTAPFVFPAGEASKNLTVYGQVLSFLCDRKLTRTDCVVALGGGVVSDLAGFAAATYLRGIPAVCLPTSLLAMVDASVGGKTGVNLPGGKNQAGAFWQPARVLCDTAVLTTLPEEERLCGYGEIIKYGMIGNPALLTRLEAETSATAADEQVIAACVRQKQTLVEADERDTGVRRLLNFGHTVGHAIEKCSNYTLPHGKAVAIGMAILTRAAEKKGCCTPGTAARLETLLRRYGLPYTQSYSNAALTDAARADKKCADGKLTLVLPERYGVCSLRPIDPADFSDWLCAGGVR